MVIVLAVIVICRIEQSKQIIGRYPNVQLTPGAIDPNATVQKLCSPGYTDYIRDVRRDVRRAVFQEYGLSYPPPVGAYEVDHFIPLELGGSNDIRNLWPEPRDPQPGFHEKDRVENYLHREVCTGKTTLTQAQDKIRKNWYLVYQSLPR
jgi:hypothetical protein